MSENIQRVLDTYETKRTDLRKEFSASAASPDVQNLIARALFGTDLAFCLFGDLCSSVSVAETETLAAFAQQQDLVDRARRIAAEGRSRIERAPQELPQELRELTERIVQQRESIAESMASIAVAPFALNVAIWRALVQVMADSLSGLYTASDRRAVVAVMKILFDRIVGMTPIGGIVGLVSDLKAIYELRDDTAAAADLAESARRYQDYTEATIRFSILASRLTEVRSATTDAYPLSLVDRATKRVERFAELVGSRP